MIAINYLNKVYNMEYMKTSFMFNFFFLVDFSLSMSILKTTEKSKEKIITNGNPTT